MSNVNSNNGLIAIIGDLTSYGGMQTNLSGCTIITEATCEITKGVTLVETAIKTGTLKPLISEKIIAGSDATVVIKGSLCSEYETLIKAYTMDSSSPYTLLGAQTSDLGYNIYNLFAVGSSASDTPYDYALGCHLVSFNITGEVANVIQFESTWVAKSMVRGATTALTNEPTAYTAGTNFLMGNVTCTLHNSKTTMNSFNISLTKNMADTKYRYQNTMTPRTEIVTGFAGTAEIVTIYDDTADPAIEAAKGSQTPVTCTINLVNSSKTWAIVMRCRILDWNRPDATKDLFEASASLELAGDATEPLTITVS